MVPGAHQTLRHSYFPVSLCCGNEPLGEAELMRGEAIQFENAKAEDSVTGI